MRIKHIALLVVLGALALISLHPSSRARAGTQPVIDSGILATVVGQSLTIDGQGFGSAPSVRSITFDYDGTSSTVSSGSAAIQSWTPTSIQLTLPPEVRHGTAHVTVDGVDSSAVEMLVFMYTRVPLPDAGGTSALPISLDIGADSRVWLIEEHHRYLKSLVPGEPTVGSAALIPQPAEGIFAQSIIGDTPTNVSGWGEDIDVASDGSIWFTQGGGALYGGVYPNASRIVRFHPATSSFSCYTSPVDNSAVFGVLVDDARGMVWYAESGFAGNAITGFDPSTIESDCDQRPHESPAQVCPGAPQPGCHARFPLPGVRGPAHLVLDGDGDIWFTEYWATGIARLNPEDGTFLRVPFAAPIVRVGAGLYVGSGPWELTWGADGKLWVSEFFDATILRVDTELAETGVCSQLSPTGENACADEVVVLSDGYDFRSVHSLTSGSDGRVWFGVSGAPARVGFISTEDDDEMVFLPLPLAGGGTGGIMEDPLTRDIWFTHFEDRSVGRLQRATGDADGVPDGADVCPLAFDPMQVNSDRDFVDLAAYGKPFNDLTWPMSDRTGDACDSDADNDGLTNSAEASPAAHGCPRAGHPLDPAVRDTDGDRVLDGVECALGSDPTQPASTPDRLPLGDLDGDFLATTLEVLLGSNPLIRDTDTDGLFDGVEFFYYGSSAVAQDSDGDGCGDRTEAASVNPDRTVNSIDLLIIALAYGSSTNPRYVPHFDVNRDGVINPADLGMTASSFGPC